MDHITKGLGRLRRLTWSASRKSRTTAEASQSRRICEAIPGLYWAHFTDAIIWNQGDHRRLGGLNGKGEPSSIASILGGSASGCQTCSFIREVLEACLGTPVGKLEGSVLFHPSPFYMDWRPIGGRIIKIEFFTLPCKHLINFIATLVEDAAVLFETVVQRVFTYKL